MYVDSCTFVCVLAEVRNNMSTCLRGGGSFLILFHTTRTWRKDEGKGRERERERERRERERERERE